MADDPVVVIGSGPCGATAAARLVGRGVEVLMLDAGTRAPRGLIARAAGHTIVRKKGWKHYSPGRQHPASDPDVEWYSSISLGGLSNYWTAAVPRFAPNDFTEGATLDERFRWPLEYDELVPYYESVERVLTVTAGATPIRHVPPGVRRYTARPPADWRAVIERAAEAAGFGMGMMPLARGRPWMIARRGTEFSSYHCVVALLEERPSFTLRTGAHVRSLLTDAASGRVRAVEYADLTQRSVRTVPCRAVVLAAGAIDSTVIMLRSRSSDFPFGLGNERDLVGRYLHDHPRQWWTANVGTPLTSLTDPVYIARDSYGSGKPLIASSLTIGQITVGDRVRSFYGGRVGAFGVQVFGTMVPEPNRGVMLTAVTDARPVITLRYDAHAVENMNEAPRRLADVLAAAGQKVTVPGPFHALTPGSSVHFGGTLRMHSSPEFGVTDGRGRVHDVANLVIADSSCFTTGPEKNPTLTAMALAARAADHLADDLHAGALG